MPAAEPMTIDELREEFEFLGDWEDQCRYLIELGEELPELSPGEKTEENRVHGCQSQVWMVCRVPRGFDPAATGHLRQERCPDCGRVNRRSACVV